LKKTMAIEPKKRWRIAQRDKKKGANLGVQGKESDPGVEGKPRCGLV